MIIKNNNNNNISACPETTLINEIEIDDIME